MRRAFGIWYLWFLLVCSVTCSATPALATDDMAGVQLGNVRVPRDKFIVFLMIGHCNMMGQARQPENSMHPRAWQFDLNQRPPRWVPATSRNNANHLGAPTLPFLQAMATAYPDYYFGVINNASSAATVQSNYRRGRSNYMQIVSAARRLKPYVTLGGVLTMLGYMEAEHANQTQWFGDQFVAMTQEMRADLEEPELPFFITQFELGATKKGRGWMAIANTIEQLPQYVPHAAVISSANFIYDSDHHPSYQSFKLWAMRAVQAINVLSTAQMAAKAEAIKVEEAKVEAAKAAEEEKERANALPVAIQPSIPSQPSPVIQLPRLAQTQPIIVPRTASTQPNQTATDSAKSLVAPPHVIAEVEAVLLKASSAPDPRQILPYKEAVASAQFEVKQVLKGNLELRRVLVMQRVIEKGQLLPAAKLTVGAKYHLKVGTWSGVPQYHTHPMFDDIMDFESPIFFVYSAEALPAS